jgi:hypothetical protein
MTNLLQSLENPWAGSHEVLVYPVDGAPYRRQKQQIQKPDGWDVWYVHNDPQWREPEATFMQRHLSPERIHTGDQSYRIFGPAGPVWAGLRTKVGVTPGELYALEAWAHGWCNHNDRGAIPGHEDCCGDPLCSWGAGRGPFVEYTENLPPLNGDPWSDALHTAAFSIGIDTQGGSDPRSPFVTWSEPLAIYNAFARLELVVQAEASIITVFLQQKLRWAFRNLDGYWDAVSLVHVDEPEEAIHWNPPAFDYVKTAVLFAPDASPELRAAGGIACSHPQLRGTDAQSVEDAATGPNDCTVKTVGWEEEELRPYLEEFYPHVKPLFIEGDSPAEIGVKLLPPLQDDVAIGMTDPRWRDHFFGEDPVSKTGTYGCVLDGCCVVLRDLYDVDVTPPILDQLLVNARVAYFAGNLIDWQGFCSLFSRLQDPIKHDRRLSEFELRSLLQDHVVILRREDGKHFVVLEHVEGEKLHVIETWDGTRKVWSIEDYLGIRAARVEPRVLKPTPPAPSPPTPTPPSGDVGPPVLFGAQQQRHGEGRDEFISRVKPPAWMLLQGYEEARRIKELSPDTKVIIRYVDNDWRSYLFADDPDAAADRFLNKFRGALEQNAPSIDFVTGLNEYIAIDDYAALRASGIWLEAYCAALERIGYPARPIGFNAGVGNPEHNHLCDARGIERQMPLMVRGARALMYARGGFGHHAYHGCRSDGFCTLTTNDSDGRPLPFHYSMRSLLSIDRVLCEHDVEVDHYLTELGAIYYDPVHRMCNAGAGWRWPATMGEGAVDRYVEELVLLNRLFVEWNRTHDGRLKAALLFLFGGNREWRYFDVEGQCSVKLADALVKVREAASG